MALSLETEVLILGGGFAGVACGRQFRRFASKQERRVCLVSDENYMVFQPLLPEVAAASISPRHVVNPIRRLCRGITVLKGRVNSVDVETRIAHINAGDFTPNIELRFQQMVLALGAEIDLSRIPGMAEHALLMQNVGDAMKLRATIISRFEEANLIMDTERRRRLLSFVVVGGGYSGVETAGEILDLMTDMHRWYGNIHPDDFCVILVHSRDVLLPTLSQKLGKYCEQKLRERGLQVILERRVRTVTANRVELDNGDGIDASTVICTVGNAPHRVVQQVARDLNLDTDRGRLRTSADLRVENCDWLWAAGDCAAVPLKGGGTSPPTAQFAQREGELLGKNLIASLQDRPTKPFTFTGLGELAAIGHRTAVADVFGMRFSGFIAWWMWRTIYLAKLPGVQRRLRVLIDWTFDLFFSRDINLLNPRYSRPIKAVLLEPGDVLFHAGEPAFSLYFVKSGVVDIHDGDHLVKRVEAGDYFGERALLGDGTWHYTATATEHTQLVALGAEEFQAIVQGSDALRTLFERSARAYLSEEDLHALEAQIAEESLDQPLSKLMNRRVDTLRASDNVERALFLMQDKPHGSYPVLNEEDKVVGVLKRDELYDQMKSGSNPKEQTVGELHLQQLPRLGPDVHGREAVEVFIRSGKNKLLVIDDDNRLVGILTIVDLVQDRIQRPSS